MCHLLKFGNRVFKVKTEGILSVLYVAFLCPINANFIYEEYRSSKNGDAAYVYTHCRVVQSIVSLTSLLMT